MRGEKDDELRGETLQDKTWEKERQRPWERMREGEGTYVVRNRSKIKTEVRRRRDEPAMSYSKRVKLIEKIFDFFWYLSPVSLSLFISLVFFYLTFNVSIWYLMIADGKLLINWLEKNLRINIFDYIIIIILIIVRIYVWNNS